MELLIRVLTPNDYTDIHRLNNSLGKVYELDKLKQRLEYIIEETESIVFVAEVKGKVVGYIQGSRYEPIYSESLIDILGFVVDEEYRGQGVGSALLSQIEGYSMEVGLKGVTLASGVDREEAHIFYENLGYCNRKSQRNYMKLFRGEL